MSEQQTSAAADENVYVLARPIVFDGAEVKELQLDFEKLTGEDVKQAERRHFLETGERPFVKELNKGYLSYIVAAAASVPVELINGLNAKDFSALTNRAQSFLLL